MGCAFDALKNPGIAAADPVRRQLRQIVENLPALKTLVCPRLGVNFLVLDEIGAIDEVFRALLTFVYGPACVVEAFRRRVWEGVKSRPLERRSGLKNQIT